MNIMGALFKGSSHLKLTCTLKSSQPSGWDSRTCTPPGLCIQHLRRLLFLQRESCAFYTFQTECFYYHHLWRNLNDSKPPVQQSVHPNFWCILFQMILFPTLQEASRDVSATIQKPFGLSNQNRKRLYLSYFFNAFNIA